MRFVTFSTFAGPVVLHGKGPTRPAMAPIRRPTSWARAFTFHSCAVFPLSPIRARLCHTHSLALTLGNVFRGPTRESFHKLKHRCSHRCTGRRAGADAAELPREPRRWYGRECGAAFRCGESDGCPRDDHCKQRAALHLDGQKLKVRSEFTATTLQRSDFVMMHRKSARGQLPTATSRYRSQVQHVIERSLQWCWL